MPGPTAQQQEHVTAVLLTAIGEFGFVLAGAGAIRAHGLTDRPTQDIDLFGGPTLGADDFSLVLERAEHVLRAAHYDVTRVREFPLFTRMRVIGPDGAMLDVDFAINWRAPTHLSRWASARSCPNVTPSRESCLRSTPGAKSATSSTSTLSAPQAGTPTPN